MNTDDLNRYPTPPNPTVEKSVARDQAFSTPAKTSSGKWAPAKGTRFRSQISKQRGRPRKREPDKRRVIFY